MKGKLYAAIWTPTDGEGRLLKKEFKDHLQFLAARGVDGVLVAGSTGEFQYLDFPTRKEVLECSVENRGSLEILFNISHCNPASVVELAKFSRSFDLDGVLLLPPIYYPVSSPDLIEYYARMAEQTQHPFYIYNFPERTGVRIGIEAIEAICDKVPVAGIKQSGGDFASLISLIEWARTRDFKVYAGNDILLPEAMMVGACGGIGGLVNVIPELYAEVLEAAHQQRGEDLILLGSKLKSLGPLVGKLSFPWNIAAFMEARGLPTGVPKMPISEATSLEYRKLVEEFRTLLQSWQLKEVQCLHQA